MMSRTEELISQAKALPPDERRRIIRELGAMEDPLDHEDGLPGQVDGYWFGSTEDIPAERPGYLPTGAVLPQGGVLVGDVQCLDLVPVEDAWYPLSDAGVYTYAHSASLTYGDSYFFVPAAAWGTIYLAEMGEPLDPAEVGKRFGTAAAKRARPDRKSVIVRLRQAK